MHWVRKYNDLHSCLTDVGRNIADDYHWYTSEMIHIFQWISKKCHSRYKIPLSPKPDLHVFEIRLTQVQYFESYFPRQFLHRQKNVLTGRMTKHPPLCLVSIITVTELRLRAVVLSMSTNAHRQCKWVDSSLTFKPTITLQLNVFPRNL